MINKIKNDLLEAFLSKINYDNKLITNIFKIFILKYSLVIWLYNQFIN